MILSTKGRYAVMAMVELASAKEAKPMPLAAIAEAQNIPLNYLEQIISSLRKRELVCAVRGPGGGYQIAATPAEISIADIMFAAEENIEMTRCAAKETGCRPGGVRCTTHNLWEGLTEHIHAYLSSISLADVIGGADLPAPLMARSALYEIREPA